MLRDSYLVIADRILNILVDEGAVTSVAIVHKHSSTAPAAHMANFDLDPHRSWPCAP